MAETKAELQAVLEEKDAELARMKAELEAANARLAQQTEQQEAQKKDANDKKRMVQVELFKDQSKYKDALYVNVNNYNAQIPRGMRVSVPYFVYRHLQETQAQDAATASLISVYESDWQKKNA